MRFAANQLFDSGGGFPGKPVFVDIHADHHTLLDFGILTEELPFTQWLGGTFILSGLGELPRWDEADAAVGIGFRASTCATLQDWISYLTAANSSSGMGGTVTHAASPLLYVWHAPQTSLDAPCRLLRL